ncbi:MAG TPA: hypothetical protein VHB18_13320, partial [Mycobacteriales bacterium]|nr:hypothetical protein [Mycobacteriales bacterium]
PAGVASTSIATGVGCGAASGDATRWGGSGGWTAAGSGGGVAGSGGGAAGSGGGAAAGTGGTKATGAGVTATRGVSALGCQISAPHLGQVEARSATVDVHRGQSSTRPPG